MSGCCGGSGLSRRQALTGMAAVGAGLPLLAACGSEDGSGSSGSSAPPLPSPGTKLTTTADVPVGGGQIFGADNVVVTQPEQGTFRAFSATCTHAGCTVNDISDGTIVCPCHLSKFSIDDGHVTAGPAPKPLPEVQITVKGGSISVA